MATTINLARSLALEALRVNVIVGRAKARLSQEQLAERARISRPTVSRLERAAGDIGVEVVQRIADALGTTIAGIFIPPSTARVAESELARRAAAGGQEFVDAVALLEAVDEAAHRSRGEFEHYSKAPTGRGVLSSIPRLPSSLLNTAG